MIYWACQYQNIAKAKLSFSSSFGYDFSFGHFSWKRDGQPLLWFPFFASPGISLPKAIGLCNWFLLWEEREHVKFHKFNIGAYGKINGGPRPDIVYCPKHGFLIVKGTFRAYLWEYSNKIWHICRNKNSEIKMSKKARLNSNNRLRVAISETVYGHKNGNFDI